MALGFPAAFARLLFRVGGGHDGLPTTDPGRSSGRHARHQGSDSAIIGELEAIEQQTDPIFARPRDIFLDMVLAQYELEAAVSKLRKAWWP